MNVNKNIHRCAIHNWDMNKTNQDNNRMKTQLQKIFETEQYSN